MRDRNRIQPFMNLITKMWEEHCPDWRFGQLISNLQSYIGYDDIFYIEDDEFLTYIKSYFEQTTDKEKS